MDSPLSYVLLSITISHKLDMKDVSGVRAKRTFAERSKRRFEDKFLRVAKRVEDMGMITDLWSWYTGSHKRCSQSMMDAKKNHMEMMMDWSHYKS